MTISLNLIVLLILCLSYGDLSAQFTFAKTIDVQENSQSLSDRGKSSIQTSDGGFISVAESSDGQEGNSLYLVKTDNQGAVQWSRTILGGSELGKVIAGGGGHALYLNSGLVHSWGSNSFGQVGKGSTSVYDPVEGPALEPNILIALAGGQGFSLAVTTDLTVRSWGANHYGQLGDGSTTDASTPRTVLDFASNPLSNIVCVAAGGMHDVHPTNDGHSLALSRNGNVYAFGSDLEGQLGDNDAAILQKSRAWPVRDEDNNWLSDMVAIGAGASHSLAVKDDGSVWAWGDNSHAQVSGNGNNSPGAPGQPARQVEGIANAVAVDGGDGHSIALLSDGSVVYWGNNYDNVNPSVNLSLQSIGGLQNIVAISAGAAHSVALDKDGRVWTWGNHEVAQLGRNIGSATYDFTPGLVQRIGGAILDNIIAISAGNFFTMALDTDGNIFTWGDQAVGSVLPFATIKTQTDYKVPFINSSNFRVAAIREVLDAQGANDGYAILGSVRDAYSRYNDYFLIKIRQVGASISLDWSKKYGISTLREVADDFEQVFDASGAPDGFVFAGYSVKDPDVLIDSWANIVRVDNDGDLEWARQYQLSITSTGSQNQANFFSVEQAFNASGQTDGFILGGSVYQEGQRQGIPAPFLLKTGNDGSWVWSKIFEYDINCFEPNVRQTRDYGYAFSAGLGSSASNENIVLLKTNDKGVRQWDRVVQPTPALPQFDLFQQDLVEVLDAQSDPVGYAVTGKLQINSAPEECALFRFALNGSHLWTQKYGDFIGTSLQQTGDLGFLIGGRTGSISQAVDLLLVKTDAGGNAGNSCTEAVAMKGVEFVPGTLAHSPEVESWVGVKDYFPRMASASEEDTYLCSPQLIAKAGAGSESHLAVNSSDDNARQHLLQFKLGQNPIARGEAIEARCITSVDCESEIVLLDLAGRIIQSSRQRFKAGINTVFLQSDSLVSGFYVLRLHVGVQQLVQSIVVTP